MPGLRQLPIAGPDDRDRVTSPRDRIWLKRGEETEDGQCESFAFNCESIRSRHMEALQRRVSGVHKSISKSRQQNRRAGSKPSRVPRRKSELNPDNLQRCCQWFRRGCHDSLPF